MVIAGRIDETAAVRLRKDFPLLSRKVNGRRIVYLDNAATSQKPVAVIEKVKDFYRKHNANVRRGLYALSLEASKVYDDARMTVAGFINAEFDEIIFTRNTTESLNLLSYTVVSILGKKAGRPNSNAKRRNKILLTELEHHSNLVPWQMLAKREGYKLEFVSLKDDFTIDESDLKRKLDSNTAIFSFSGVSNTLGTKMDVALFCRMARDAGAISVVDAAQLAPHSRIDIKKLGCDFLAFSSHKMLGPSGVGVLYGRRDLLQELAPFNTGGSMISEVSYQDSSFAEPPVKFEGGTPNMEGAAGFAEAIKYLEKVGIDNIERWEHELLVYALSRISSIPGITIYSPGSDRSAGTLSFNIEGVHPHDAASLLDDRGICVRAGHHCAMPLMNKLGIAGTIRVSFYLYNTKEDVDFLVEALKEVHDVFSKKVMPSG
jgi:cysteine desulfurase / selenocysteine lyase